MRSGGATPTTPPLLHEPAPNEPPRHCTAAERQCSLCCAVEQEWLHVEAAAIYRESNFTVQPVAECDTALAIEGLRSMTGGSAPKQPCRRMELAVHLICRQASPSALEARVVAVSDSSVASHASGSLSSASTAGQRFHFAFHFSLFAFQVAVLGQNGKRFFTQLCELHICPVGGAGGCCC
jgi:hypothetical protein